MRMIVFFLALVFLCSVVCAISGVVPGSYDIDFEAGLKQDFVFNFVFEKGVDSDIRVDGDLARYVSVDKEEISGGEVVVASLVLPSSIDTPGVNSVRVWAGDVSGVIRVDVPYPESWVDLELIAPNANVGEIVDMRLKIFNKGSVVVSVEPMIQIFKGVELLDSYDFDEVVVNPFGYVVVEFPLNSSVYVAGDYVAMAFGDYGEKRLARADNPFRLGELRVKVVSYTSWLKEGDIGRFEIDVESFWDNDIDDLYAELIVDGFDDIGFVTTVTDLKAWERKTLVGFLSVNGVGAKTLDATIALYYRDRTNSERIELSIELGYDYSNLFFVFGILIVVALIIWRVVVFVKGVKKHRRK